MVRLHYVWSLALVSYIGLATCQAQQTPLDLTRPIRGEAPNGVPLRFLGTNSCSSNACHNRGNERGAVELSLFEPRTYWEHGYWRRFDPHAESFNVLGNDESEQILRSFRRLDPNQPADARSDGLCLSCHVHQNFSNSFRTPQFALTDGVGCEGCHGASEYWSAAHVRGDWDYRSREEKAALGFVPLDSLADRARSCTPCHVGSSYKDPVHGLVEVNHDLIAAGHPRLQFEFSSYHARYPRHWSDLDERAADPTYELRAWIVGQLATSEASLKLLEARAARASMPLEASAGSSDDSDLIQRTDYVHTGPWPEFSEYNCFACHHNLKGGIRDGVAGLGGSPGSMPWGTWYQSMLDPLGSLIRPRASDWPASLQSLRAEMGLPAPDERLVTERAGAASSVIGQWLDQANSTQLGLEDHRELLEWIVATVGDPEKNPTWEENAQAYLGLVAIYVSQSELRSDPSDIVLRAQLEAIAEALRFEVGSGNPEDYRSDVLPKVLSATDHGN